MQLTIHGPNLNKQNKGTFHVHTAGCRDNDREVKNNGSVDPYTAEFASRDEVASFIYADHMAEDPSASVADYVADFHFAPCCDALPFSTSAKAGKPRSQPKAAYKVKELKFDAKLVEQVAKRRAGGESLATIAKALKVTTGKAAMAELVATTPRVAVADPAKLARAVAKDRKAGASWGLLAARYGITEGTCRAAYTAASGQPWTSLDYRRKKAEPKPATKAVRPRRQAAKRTAKAKAAA